MAVQTVGIKGPRPPSSRYQIQARTGGLLSWCQTWGAFPNSLILLTSRVNLRLARLRFIPHFRGHTQCLQTRGSWAPLLWLSDFTTAVSKTQEGSSLTVLAFDIKSYCSEAARWEWGGLPCPRPAHASLPVPSSTSKHLNVSTQPQNGNVTMVLSPLWCDRDHPWFA